MKLGAAKALLAFAQAMPVLVMAELLILRSIWTLPLAFAAIALLGKVRCQHCDLPGWDKRVMGTRVPVRLSAFNRCPRCGNPMLPN